MNTEPAFGHSHELRRRTRFTNALTSVTLPLTALVFLVAVLLWTALFTSYAPVHDALHALRHALFMIPCH